MASVAGTKRRAENKSCKIKFKALKELEKGTAPKDVAALFGVPSSTLSTTEEVLKAISVLEDFSLFSSFGKAMMKSLKDLNHNVEKDVLCTRKQTFISDFFSK